MSNDTEPRAPRTDGAAPVDGLDDQAALSPGQVLMQVYAFFYKKSVGLVLLLLTGLLSLLGVLFAQMPSDLKNDPQATARWLEQARQVYGGWTDVLHKAGVFHMFSSVPFLIVMGAARRVDHRVHRAPASDHLASRTPPPHQGDDAVLRPRPAPLPLHRPDRRREGVRDRMRRRPQAPHAGDHP